ncbi:hypothetical protein Pelo_19448 [Pelomyxa schiedti]|nr:hypothetical protein Pelo_19448 [Pelomyxa schiedti]
MFWVALCQGTWINFKATSGKQARIYESQAVRSKTEYVKIEDSFDPNPIPSASLLWHFVAVSNPQVQ